MRLYGSMEINDDNKLIIAGINTEKLVKKYGTPLLVLDEYEIKQNIKKYRQALQFYAGESQILYASKAFANRTLYRILMEENISLDVVSGGELYTALAADFPSNKIFFHGNNKLPGEIEMGFNNNIGGFFIDNFQEAALLEKIASQREKKIKVFLRLKPGLTAHTHEFMVTGQDDSKFGVGIGNDNAIELIQMIIEDYHHLNLAGIHAHIGSQIYEKKAYLKLIKMMIMFMHRVKEKMGYTLTALDLGGGLGIPQTETDPDISIKKFMKRIIEGVENECHEKSFPLPKLMVEPVVP